jgi:nicotinate-nucleotide pyrophosphorylase (carboxylating)
MISAHEPRRFAVSVDRGGRLSPAAPLEAEFERVALLALAEDVGAGDLTSEGAVPAAARARGELLVEEPGVVCGLPALRAVFAALDGGLEVAEVLSDGDVVGQVPAVVARVEGPARAILTGERVALNLLGRLSGIATLTAAYVAAVAGTGATILDTRKTTPGLRALERYAVRCGGGANHRFALDAAVLLKENHLRLAGGIAAALAALPDSGETVVEVEVETLAELAEALAAGARRILLDNMTPTQAGEAVRLAAGAAVLEASGGITLANVRAYAETGVDLISVGALTHSARALDVSLELA